MDKIESLNLDMVDGLWLYLDTQNQDEFIKTISDWNLWCQVRSG